MAESFVVDASVVAKWFDMGRGKRQGGHAHERRLDGRGAELFAPSLLLFEVSNSIWKNQNIETRTAISLTRLAARIAPKRVNPSQETAEQAMRLARGKKLTFYDAVYRALSKSLSLR